MAKSNKTTEIEKKNEAPKEMVVHDYGEDFGAGFEGTNRDDFSIPFIDVFQSNSPRVQDEEEGVKPGLLFNSVTGEILGESVNFVPAHREHCFVEWIDREKGGGFVARHELNSDVVLNAKKNAQKGKGGKLILSNGNHLVETFYIYGIFEREGGRLEAAVLSFSSTKIKVYRKLMTKLNMYQIPGPNGRKMAPPLFAHRCTLSTVTQKNPQGTFKNFQLESANGSVADSLLPPNDERYQSARDFAKMVKDGGVKLSDPTPSGEGEEEADIPF